MNIIFGNPNSELLEKYTILELDTIKTPTGELVPHWCLIENVPLSEFSILEANKELHSKLLENYRRRNWEFCLTAVESLMGKWNGEMDTFYEEIAKRVDRFVQDPPDAEWDGTWTVVSPVTT